MGEQMQNLLALIVRKADEYGDSELYNEARQLADLPTIIKIKVRGDLELTEEEKAYIEINLK